MPRWLTQSLLIAVAVAACEASPPERASPVGRTGRRYVDPSRHHYSAPGPRPLLTTLWYPAQRDVTERPWTIGVFRAGFNAVDAALPTPATPRPLVIMSHGTGGAAAQLSWVAEALASRGFIVAAVNHHGNTAAEPRTSPEGFALWWERALDVTAALDRLLADRELAPHIDPERIGALGFSLGGYTVLGLAGARLDLEQWRQHCLARPEHPSCALPPEAGFDRSALAAAAQSPAYKASLARAGEPFADERVRAVFAIAPVHGPALTTESLRAIRTPVAIVVGADDDQALPADVKALSETVPAASLSILPAVAHYSFLAPCTRFGRWFAGPLCQDPIGSNREQSHQRVARMARAFFEQRLKEPIVEP